MNLKDMKKPVKPSGVALADAIVAGWRSPFSTACSIGELRHEASLVVDEETGLVVRARVPIIKVRYKRHSDGHLGGVE